VAVVVELFGVREVELFGVREVELFGVREVDLRGAAARFARMTGGRWRGMTLFSACTFLMIRSLSSWNMSEVRSR
jgi:hypothetical protein